MKNLKNNSNLLLVQDPFLWIRNSTKFKRFTLLCNFWYFTEFKFWWLTWDCSKPKIGCLTLIDKRQTSSRPFNVLKNDVWSCSMSLISKSSYVSYYVQYSMSHHLKPKIERSSSITNRWTGSSSFNVQKLMFNLDWCSIKCCCTHYYQKWCSIFKL